MKKIFALAFVAFAASCASAPTNQAFDPREWRGQHLGPATQVLNLGSSHLAELPAGVPAGALNAVLDRLAVFKPDIITHEGLSGEQCDVVKRYETRHPDIYKDYCRGAAAAQAATGGNVAEAMVRSEQMLANWPASPSPSQRRALAATFVAAGDLASALVQWLQLPEAERKIGDGIDATLLDLIARESLKPNETYQVGVALAVRLGLQRIYAVDDHTADSIQAAAGKDLGPFLQAHWSDGKSAPIYEEYKRLIPLSGTPSGMLSLYQLVNRPELGRAFVTLDYKGAMNKPSLQNFGRVYVAWWETRNLRMVANIREAFGNRPGSRVLNIVGASHKPYYDAYLGMMSDVTVVDAAAVLR